MKCSHPDCNRGIGLVSYRRGFGKGRYCSKKCRDSYVCQNAEHPSARTYFEWLFLQPPGTTAQMARAAVRVESR